MKRISSAAVALLALSGAASPADLTVPTRPATPAAVVASAFNWTGCYIGGHLGGAFGRDPTFTDLGNTRFGSFSGGVTAARVLPSHSWSPELDSSFTGGGTLGCNWQAPGSAFVIGVEGEGGYMRLRGHAFDPRTIDGTGQTTLDVLGNAKAGDWYAMATGRIGYAFDRAMVYVKGGAAFVPVRASVNDACLTIAQGCGNWIISTSVQETKATWTLGGGTEWALNGNWSVKAEYMFIGLDRTLTSCGTATTATGAAVAGGQFCFDHEFGGVHTAKVGLNYRFGPQ